ncbi:hypothetical protein BSZ32_09310 [Rubritalea profundi]|uniref:Uncharacterized protein n=2 Tax=Rubritalea profundi TaxID=1658618 RepID=A0A2S7U102_9BACT|nr:hypothetical protein BSZ32_09310 [Rubritalea profundi]
MAMDRKVVEAKVDEVLSAKIKKNATARREKQSAPDIGMPNMGADNPFAAFGAGGMPDLSAMSGMQGGKLPLKMRIMTKLAGLAMNPKFSRFLQKKWWPLWVVFGILLSGFIVIGAVLFLIWKMIKGIIGAYTDMFKKRS